MFFLSYGNEEWTMILVFALGIVFLIGLYAWRIVGTVLEVRLAEHRLREQLARRVAALRRG